QRLRTGTPRANSPVGKRMRLMSSRGRAWAAALGVFVGLAGLRACADRDPAAEAGSTFATLAADARPGAAACHGSTIAVLRVKASGIELAGAVFKPDAPFERDEKAGSASYRLEDATSGALLDEG